MAGTSAAQGTTKTRRFNGSLKYPGRTTWNLPREVSAFRQIAIGKPRGTKRKRPLKLRNRRIFVLLLRGTRACNCVDRWWNPGRALWWLVPWKMNFHFCLWYSVVTTKIQLRFWKAFKMTKPSQTQFFF